MLYLSIKLSIFRFLFLTKQQYLYTYQQQYGMHIFQFIIINKINILLIKDEKKMFKKWSSYSLKMRNARQNYFALFRRRLQLERAKIITNMSRRIKHSILFGSIAITSYYFGNQIYSQHLQKKKMKKKLMKSYPQQTYIISFDSDPMQFLQQVQIKNISDKQQVNHLVNNHCIFINDQAMEGKQKDIQEIKKIKDKLGGTIIVFSPKSMDELCHALMRCHKYRHTAVVGNYQIPQPKDSDFNNSNSRTITKQYYDLLKQSLNKIDQSIQKDKYLVIDLSQYKTIQIDSINDILQAQAGAKCSQINKILQSKGFQPLFQPYCSDLSVYELISNNLPLKNNQSLSNQLHNLSLVSAEGIRFKSSVSVQKFGQIPNLTSLFIGTGGAFAVPAKIQIKINRKDQDKSYKYYSIQSQNLSDLIIKWRKLRQNLAKKHLHYKLYLDKKTKIIIQTQNQLTLGKQIPYIEQPSYQNQLNSKQNNEIQYIFSINNTILQKIILNNTYPCKLIYDKNILSICYSSNTQNLRSLISNITLLNGVLIWCKDKEKMKDIKEKIDLTQASAQLMKKIVQVRQGIDQRRVLHAHDRYEKYFAKGFFRKITQVFW